MFFAIPLERILSHRVVWYSAKTLWINGAPDEDVPDVAPAEEFEPFDPARYRELPDVPDAHVAYLCRMRKRERRPLMFVHTPHIFVPDPWTSAAFAPFVGTRRHHDQGQRRARGVPVALQLTGDDRTLWCPPRSGLARPPA